jgi:5S rRNA maturation endonuclease (ribonuclease M5)
MNKEEILFVLEELNIRNIKIGNRNIMHSCVSDTHNGQDNNPSSGIKICEGVSIVNCFGCGNRDVFFNYIKNYCFNNQKKIKREKAEFILNYIIECESFSEIEEKREDPQVPLEMFEYLNRYKKVKKFGRIFGDRKFWGKYNLGSNKKRILFPIIDKEGEIKLIQGRWIDETWEHNRVVKYKFYPQGGHKSLYLYGEHLITNKINKLIVTEGVIDAINVNYFLEEFSKDSILSIALMGSKTSKEQLNKIKKFAKNEIILMLDNDKAGYNERDNLINKLKNTHKLSIINFSEKDPDLFLHKRGGEEFLKVLNNRKSVFELELERKFKPKNFEKRVPLDNFRFVRYNENSIKNPLHK